MIISGADVDVLRQEYDALNPVLTRFVVEVSHQLNELIQKAAVSLSLPLQGRVKSWQSVYDKIKRLKMDSLHLKALQDLVGFRIILQFRRDIETIKEIINNFNIIEQYDTADRLKEDQFGYSSIHFIVELPTSWLVVPTFAGLEGTRAEIQVRTTAQHIWAAASHTLQYKNEAAVPPAVRRTIHRVSALLELVDLEFDRVLSERDSYRAEVATGVEPTALLNVDLLEQVLSNVWPKLNRSEEDDDYGVLLEELLHFDIKEPQQLSELLKRHYDAVIAEDHAQVEHARQQTEKGGWTHPYAERIAAEVYFSHTGLSRIALGLEFGEKWRARRSKRQAASGPLTDVS